MRKTFLANQEDLVKCEQGLSPFGACRARNDALDESSIGRDKHDWIAKGKLLSDTYNMRVPINPPLSRKIRRTEYLSTWKFWDSQNK